MQNVKMTGLACQSKPPIGNNGRRNRRPVGAHKREDIKGKGKPHQRPSKFTLAGNKGEIEFEGNTDFPTELVDKYTNAGEEAKRGSQIKSKDNMDEVGQSLCNMVNETIFKQTRN